MMERENELLAEISDLKDAYFNLLSSLFTLSETISFRFKIEELFQITLEQLHLARAFYFGSIFLMESGEYRLIHSRGEEGESARASAMSQDLFPWVLEGQKKVSVLPDFDESTGQDKGSVILVPLLFQEEPLGIICLLSKLPPDQYVKQDIELFTIIGNQTAVAIKNAMLYTTMEEKNRELGSLKNYLENVLENMTNAIFVTDLNGKITTFNRNAEKLFDIQSEQMLGKHFRDLIPEKSMEEISVAIMTAKDMRKPGLLEMELGPEGESIPLEVTVTPVVTVSGGVSDFIISCRDLSQTREIERLKELDEMKSELLSNVSHELKTPLTSIKAYSETLLNMLDAGESEPATEKEFIGIIDKEAERLTELINELLTLSRIESRRLSIKAEQINLEDLVREIIALMKEMIKKKEIRCSFEFPVSVVVRNDREKIKQILVNLIGNAVKYNRDKGKIRISLKSGEQECELRITDTGIGIAREDLDRIFERFYRVDSSLTYEVSGTGLGLAICKDLIEACGGRIVVWSKPGIGSIFRLFLPMEI